MDWLRKILLRWLGLADYDARLKDVERHFVTRYDTEGGIAETLADVPVEKRKELKTPKRRGLSWFQQRALLEATDGFSRAPVPDRIESTS